MYDVGWWLDACARPGHRAAAQKTSSFSRRRTQCVESSPAMTLGHLQKGARGRCWGTWDLHYTTACGKLIRTGEVRTTRGRSRCQLVQTDIGEASPTFEVKTKQEMMDFFRLTSLGTRSRRSTQKKGILSLGHSTTPRELQYASLHMGVHRQGYVLYVHYAF